jgi:hypothetical protein
LAIRLLTNPPIDGKHLNVLFLAAWPGHVPRDFDLVLARSLVYVCGFDGERLIGFVNARGRHEVGRPSRHRSARKRS